MLQSNYFFKSEIFQLSVQFGFIVFECQLGLQRKVSELSGLQKKYIYPPGGINNYVVCDKAGLNYAVLFASQNEVKIKSKHSSIFFPQKKMNVWIQGQG